MDNITDDRKNLNFQGTGVRVEEINKLKAPGDEGGLVQRTNVDVSNLASRARECPILQSSREPFTNPDPATSITVPPDAGPTLGLMDNRVAGSSNISEST